uniref:Fibronectin type-III domain-containing protein n=1 Tax=Plectus sambesii TaxID=2011161 RepID=A0A914V3J8_9BILA
MTRWQTITVRNKMYAILKHLLSPGRYYMFRVGAVNIHGSRDFSAPSEPFKLSKEAKAPSRPRNLSLGAMTADGSGLLNQLVLWLPPASDLPIVHYQVTWSLSDESAAEAAFSDMPRPPRHEKLQSSHAAGSSKLSDSNEFDIGGFESEIIPAEKSYVELRNLKPNTLYLIEVHAIVDSEAGELHGEKAVIFLDSNVTKLAGKESSTTSTSSRPTGSSSSSIAATTTTTMTTTTTTTTTTAATTPETQRRAAHLSDLQIQNPFVKNGLLKADMSWRVDRFQLLEDVLDFRFEIRWWPVACFGANSNPELLLSDPFQADALSNSYELFDLQFACHYLVNVTVVVNGDRIGEAVQAAFDTPACDDARVDGETEPECPVVAPRVPSPVENLNCRVFGRGNLTAICTWEAPVQSDNDVTGYRVISGRKMAQLSDITDADAFPSLDRDTVS